ncbi:MAG: thiamine-binding protein [Chloroflexi bacterium]|nr:thiamine-binding protein [Chloroflexota bacterium]
MQRVSAQVSIYPLRQARLGRAVEAFLAGLRARDVAVETGPASTAMVGELDAVFAALRDGFAAAAEIGECALVVTLSNACDQHAVVSDAEQTFHGSGRVS